MESLLPEIQKLMQEHFQLSAGQVEAGQTLTELGIDSLGAIEFMFQLEDRFGVSLSEERGELRTVADVAAIVERALSAKKAVA